MKIFVKPTNPEIQVRNPVTKLHIPDVGMVVESSQYWARRIVAGDVMTEPLPQEQKAGNSSKQK